MQLSALYRYVLKSCRAEALDHAPIGALGIAFDRHWMVADSTGRMITGRDEPLLVRLVVRIADGMLEIRADGTTPLWVPLTAFTAPTPASVWRSDFQAFAGNAEADRWLSRFLGREVRLLYIGENSARRIRRRPELPVSFADSYPVLLASEDSLRQLEEWIGRPMEMQRFRPNLVVSGSRPFAEDGWKRLRIGDMVFSVEKPCERCVFTTVDPVSGEKSHDQEPLRTLAKFRKTPDGVLFGMNLIAENEGEVRVGMDVEILG